MPVNDTTANRGYQLPHPTNNLDYDVARLRASFNAIDADVGSLLTSVAGKAAASHTHVISDVSGLQSALDAKMAANASLSLDFLSDVDTAGAASNMFLRFLNGAWVPVAFDASMVASGTLNINRMPAHGHSIADVTALQAALDGKAAASHSHAIGDVTNLQTSLDGKASISGANLFTGQQTYAGRPQQFDAALNLQPSTHATSERCGIVFDAWYVGQDWNGWGTKDFFIYTSQSGGLLPLFIKENGIIGIGTGNPTVQWGKGINIVDANESAIRCSAGGRIGFDFLQTQIGDGVIINRDYPFIVFATQNTERGRIAYDGLLWGTQNGAIWQGTNGTGVNIYPDYIAVARANNPPITAIRQSSDGAIAHFTRDGNAVFTIENFGETRLTAGGGKALRLIANYDYNTGLQVETNGTLTSLPSYNNTGTGSTLVISSAGQIRRTSSSIKYKKDIEKLSSSLVDNVINKLRPIWYRSKLSSGDDKPQWSHIGLIAEEVAAIEPRLVRYKTVDVSYKETPIFDDNGNPVLDENNEQKTFVEAVETVLSTPEPEDVDYGRLSVVLLDAVQRMKAELDVLKTDCDAYKRAHP